MYLLTQFLLNKKSVLTDKTNAVQKNMSKCDIRGRKIAYPYRRTQTHSPTPLWRSALQYSRLVCHGQTASKSQGFHNLEDPALPRDLSEHGHTRTHAHTHTHTQKIPLHDLFHFILIGAYLRFIDRPLQHIFIATFHMVFAEQTP